MKEPEIGVVAELKFYKVDVYSTVRVNSFSGLRYH